MARNLAVRWLPEHPRTGIDPDVAVLLPGPTDFDDLNSYRVWEPGRPPPVLAVEVVSSGHPYKDYSWVHEGYAAMGAPELLVFDRAEAEKSRAEAEHERARRAELEARLRELEGHKI